MSKFIVVSKPSILLEPKLVVVSKMKYVPKLKNRPLGKVVHDGAGMLTALTTTNDEILVESKPYSGNLAPFRSDLPP